MAETIKDRIQQRLDALSLSARAASLQATGSDGTIRNILKEKSVDPRHGTLEKLAPVLQTSVDWLRYGDAGRPPAQSQQMPAIGSDIEAHDFEPQVLGHDRKAVEIRGTAMGSIIQEVEGFIIEPETIGFVKRPASLERVTTAYAILVTGDSMWPMHPPGEVRLVNPTKPTAPGDSVIVMTKHWDHDPGQAYIKILKRRTQKSYFVEQFNPPAILEIPAQYVVACHYVLTQNDILGY